MIKNKARWFTVLLALPAILVLQQCNGKQNVQERVTELQELQDRLRECTTTITKIKTRAENCEHNLDSQSLEYGGHTSRLEEELRTCTEKQGVFYDPITPHPVSNTPEIAADKLQRPVYLNGDLLIGHLEVGPMKSLQPGAAFSIDVKFVPHRLGYLHESMLKGIKWHMRVLPYDPISFSANFENVGSSFESTERIIYDPEGNSSTTFQYTLKPKSRISNYRLILSLDIAPQTPAQTNSTLSFRTVENFEVMLDMEKESNGVMDKFLEKSLDALFKVFGLCISALCIIVLSRLRKRNWMPKWVKLFLEELLKAKAD